MRVSDLARMSFSIPGCFSDLLCAEDSGVLSTDSPAECSPVFDSPAPFSDEESIAGFIEDETNFVQGVGHLAQLQPDSSSRSQSISWILKVRAYYGFQPLTAYLAVNYFDRFLCAYRLPGERDRKQWARA